MTKDDYKLSIQAMLNMNAVQLLADNLAQLQVDHDALKAELAALKAKSAEPVASTEDIRE